jgi:O-antigen ligase
LRINFIAERLKPVLRGEAPLKTIVADRLVSWRGGIAVTKSSPIVGVGLGRYMIELPKHKERLGEVVNDNAGNQYLQIAAEQGLIGLTIFLFLIGSVIVEFLQCQRKTLLQYGALAALAGMMVSFFFGAHIKNLEVNFFFWGILALLAVPFGTNQHEHSK